MIELLSHIRAMSPYALSQMNAPDGKTLMSLSQNESLRPPSPLAIAAATHALQNSALYPDPDWRDLRLALAQLHNIDADGIVCGNGSLDLIGNLARIYSGPARAALVPAHAYPFFKTASQMANARIDCAEETDATVSVDHLLGAVQPDTAIVFVANPGNPTGSRIPLSELQRLRAGLPHSVLLVIDEAYGEFADTLDERAFDFVESGNTVVLRTFSKAYGMAGFRVGWGLFPNGIATQLNKVMNPKNIAAASQAAAVAALSDQDYMHETCALTASLRQALTRDLEGLGLRVYQSFTNFVLIDMGSVAAAEHMDRELQRETIFLRSQTGAGLAHCLRMTIGPQHILDASIAIVRELQGERQI